MSNATAEQYSSTTNVNTSVETPKDTPTKKTSPYDDLIASEKVLSMDSLRKVFPEGTEYGYEAVEDESNMGGFPYVRLKVKYTGFYTYFYGDGASVAGIKVIWSSSSYPDINQVNMRLLSLTLGLLENGESIYKTTIDKAPTYQKTLASGNKTVVISKETDEEGKALVTIEINKTFFDKLDKLLLSEGINSTKSFHTLYQRTLSNLKTPKEAANDDQCLFLAAKCFIPSKVVESSYEEADQACKAVNASLASRDEVIASLDALIPYFEKNYSNIQWLWTRDFADDTQKYVYIVNTTRTDHRISKQFIPDNEHKRYGYLCVIKK